MDRKTFWRNNLNHEVLFWRSMFGKSCPHEQWVRNFHDRIANDHPFPGFLNPICEFGNASPIVVWILKFRDSFLQETVNSSLNNMEERLARVKAR